MIYVILGVAVISLIIGITNYFEIKKINSGPKQYNRKELLEKPLISADERSKYEPNFKEEINDLVAQLPKNIKSAG